MLPGFSANSSLYRSRRFYRGYDASSVTDASVAVEVVTASSGPRDAARPDGPFLPRLAGNPSTEMPLHRNFLNGNGPFCKPSHGPCVSSTLFPTGCAEVIRTAECDTDEIACRGCANPCKGGTMCSGICTITSGDPRNCGQCGNVCLVGETCQNGQCVCPAPNSACVGACTNLQSDPNHCGSCNNACAGSEICCNGTCTGTVAGVLYSNSNYVFDNNCQNITGLSVTMNVTQDMLSDSGFTLQLNADSPSGIEPDAWQQYGFSVGGGSIDAFINNWQDVSTQIVCGTVGLCSTPLNNGLPSGYTLGLQLQYDGSQNVTGAN